MSTYITTYTGRKYDYVEPSIDAIDIHDIAHSLSLICRYLGHLPILLSVAEHSVHVSRMVPKKYALAALLHDAHEAYVTDLPSPLKNMPDIKKVFRFYEKQADRLIHEKFGLKKCHDIVKKQDLLIRKYEKQWRRGEKTKFDFGWTSKTAEREFLKRFYELS
jgi:5'-deoxynucleotidase YfbR-like HD superfamily hydrolase